MAVDIKITGEERFKGKRVVRIGTEEAMKNPVLLIQKIENALANM